MKNLIEDFKAIIMHGEKRLMSIDEKRSEIRPGPGLWSGKEILGHLIDSAANNHRRFVEAHWRDDLVFPGYDQEKWVAAQDYQETRWEELIQLWKAYNLHLLHVVATTPHAVLTDLRKEHSLDRIAWRKVEKGQPTSLEYLIRDYLAHMEDHLSQITAGSAA